MNIENQKIEELLPGYFSGDLPENSRAMIDEWRNESPENELLYHESQKAWEALPLLYEMEQFNSFEALNKINSRISETISPSWWMYLQKIAAILLLPLLIYSVYITVFSYKGEKGQSVVLQTISSRQGMVSQFTLADGTKVWLNSGSQLQFPLKFDGNRREVSLRGEAFFEVAKNKKQPFRVNAKDLNIDVLGTSFNVVSYDNDTQTEVTLVEGKVKLSVDSKNSLHNLSTMTPGQRAIHHNGAQKVLTEEVSVDKYIAWRDGNLIFSDDNMEEVVKRLSRWFNVEIVINDPELNKYSYKATFRNESLKQVLELLKISAPIDYQISGNNTLPNGEFSKQKVYLMKKKS